jgi:hypothetical protein
VQHEDGRDDRAALEGADDHERAEDPPGVNRAANTLNRPKPMPARR